MVPEGTIKDPAPWAYFLSCAGAFWKLTESLNSCRLALPWILDQAVSLIGFCPHRGQPVTLSSTFFLVHSQPHWKGGASTEAPNV